MKHLEARRVSSKPTRGPARPIAQLSELQRKILAWVYHCGGKGKQIAWSAKKFCADTNTESTRFAVSAALASLAKRELIVKSGFQPNVTVRLMRAGILAAEFEIEYGKTPRQLQDEMKSEHSVSDFYEELKNLQDQMQQHRHTLEIFKENDGILFSLPAGNILEQSDYEREFWEDFEKLERHNRDRFLHLASCGLDAEITRGINRAFRAFSNARGQWLNSIRELDSTFDAPF